MLSTAKKTYLLLTREERRKAIWLIFAILLMAIFEVVGIASVFPFMQVVINPQIIDSNEKLAWFYNFFHFTNHNTFLLVLGISVLLLVLVSIAFTAFANWALLEFTYMRGYTFSKRLFTKYILKGYEFYLLNNSSELNNRILSEVSQAVSGVLMPIIQLIAKGVVAVFILALLMLLDPLVALLGGGVLCGTYLLFYLSIRNKIKDYGKARLVASQTRFKVATEGFGGIKEIKLLHAEKVFVEMFSEASRKFAHYHSMNQTLNQLPKYVMESITFGGVLLGVLYLIFTNRSADHILPMLSVYVFAGYRLIPALQQIFAGVTTARFYRPSLEFLFEDLGDGVVYPGESVVEEKALSPLPFSGSLKLEGVEFAYANTPAPIIKDLNISIGACTKVAFVGSTGAGKTTVVDIILGLQSPQKGTMSVDNVEVNALNVRQWQRNIGYVPQNIFLADDTILHNIAFGVPDHEVDIHAVESAARSANIHDFISNELPTGYGTVIGERGVRLSGGQRQRIGIARALYRNPFVLIFDEATNSLDGVTEEAVVQAINTLSSKKTIIMIAHRLSTVKNCDMIYVFDRGKVVGQGRYQDLCTSCQTFNSLVKAGT